MTPSRPLRFLSVLLLGATGCTRYAPTPSLSGTGARVSVALENMTLPAPQTDVRLRLRLTTPMRLRQVRVTAPTRPACHNGSKAEKLKLDDSLLSESTPINGDHILVAQFSDLRSWVQEPSVIDLEFRDGTNSDCVRLPLSGRLIRYEQVSRPAFVSGFDVFGGTPVAGHFGSAHFRVGYGGWLGRVRVTAESGIGVASCEASLCGKNGKNEDTLRSAVAFPIALSLQYIRLYDEGASIMGQGFGIGLRYVGMYTPLPALTGTERRVIHSFSLVPSWAVGDSLPVGFSSARQPPTMELEFPVGLRAGVGENGTDVGLSIGFGLRFAGPL
jgi:hypothetical protein